LKANGGKRVIHIWFYLLILLLLTFTHRRLTNFMQKVMNLCMANHFPSCSKYSRNFLPSGPAAQNMRALCVACDGERFRFTNDKYFWLITPLTIINTFLSHRSWPVFPQSSLNVDPIFLTNKITVAVHCWPSTVHCVHCATESKLTFFAVFFKSR